MLTKIVGRVVSQDGAVIQSGTVLFQTKKSGIYEQSLRAPGTEIRNILDGMIEDIHLTPGVYTVHVLPDGSLDAPWNFRIALDGTLPEVDLFEQAPIDDIGGYDKTSLIAAIAESVNPVLGGYVEDAQDAQAAAKISETNADGSASSASTSAGTATTQANRAKTEADRAQALANGIGTVATMRVDTTIGRRVFVSNGTTEEMVSGDTGWRDIRDLFVGLNDEKYSALELRIKRVNDTVHLRATITSSDNKFSGVRLYTQSLVNGFKLAGNFDWPAGYYLFTFLIGTLNSSAYVSMTPQGGNGTGTSAGMRVLTQWQTTDSWPTTLPGNPA